jgi:hypothetical protein
MNHEGAAVSRATSVSRTKKEDSTLSRNRSLINKNVAPQDLRPSDILIERFVAWKAIVKQLITYFEGLTDIQNDTAKELTKLGAVLQVPFRAGNQFLGEGGLQVRGVDVLTYFFSSLDRRIFSTTSVTRLASWRTSTQISDVQSTAPLSSICRSCGRRSRHTLRCGHSRVE